MASRSWAHRSAIFFGIGFISTPQDLGGDRHLLGRRAPEELARLAEVRAHGHRAGCRQLDPLDGGHDLREAVDVRGRREDALERRGDGELDGDVGMADVSLGRESG